MLSRPTQAAGLSIASNTSLVLLKVGAGLAMGSVSVIAEGLHSLLDLVAALITFFSLRIAARPPDTEHPFGHGKAENISATMEGGLILVAAALIIYEAVKRLIVGARLELVEVGMGVMLFSVLVNLLVSRHLFRVGRAHESLALEADARHLTTDVLTSLGVLGGLLAVRLTGFHTLDPIIALGVALLILKAAYEVMTRSFAGLLDVRLPPEEEELIQDSIRHHGRELVGFHQLRTRKAGSFRYIDLHLVLSPGTTLDQAHRLCDHLEADIKFRLPRSSITIHCEPPEEGKA